MAPETALAAPNGMDGGGGVLLPPPEALCPAGTLPDEQTCVRLPDDDGAGPDTSPEAAASSNGHHEKGSGRWVVYDQIPRRPDRPEDYDAYRYPV
ncbi:MAG: hypothetical protein M3O50_12270, partial [Myxococcota bacterium]|nr:hypothetical protein [Myxococcota bacterium]